MERGETTNGTQRVATTLTSRQLKGVGALLGCFVGDALGAPIESWTAQAIQKEYGRVMDMKTGVHLGVGIGGGPRKGMYTDDTNCCLALADSLVECKGLDPQHIANNYVKFWRHEPKRGYPGHAEKVLRAIEEGQDIHTTGTMVFPEGSYSNGGAMRIAPIGVAFVEGIDDDILHEAVRLSILTTHVHPQAIDAAWIVAKAINVLVPIDPGQLTPYSLLDILAGCAKDKAMKDNILLIQRELPNFTGDGLKELPSKPLVKQEKEEWDDCSDEEEEGEVDKELDFLIYSFGDNQLMAVDAVSCALWCLTSCWNKPEEGLIKAVNLGGDVDTIGAITGAMLGALHGIDWIPERWWNELENGCYGRDWAVSLGQQLAELNLQKLLEPHL